MNLKTEKKAGTKKALVNFTGYLTLLAATVPVLFTAAVFLGIASTGDLGSSISKVLLG